MISLLITNYNTWDLTLKSVKAAISQADAHLISEMIIIDDDSSSNAPEELSIIDKVNIHYNKANLGYATCVNKAFELAKENICLLLDSDAYLISGLTFIVERFNQNPNLGILSFKLVDAYGKATGSAEPEVNSWSIALGQQLDARIGKYLYEKSKKWSIFSCAMAVQKKAFLEVGGFDTSFDFLDADHDFSMKINRSPWTIEFENNCLIYHIGNGSPQKTSKRVIRFYQNRIKLLKKYNKLSFWYLIYVLIIFRLCIESLSLLLVGSFKFSTAVLKDKLYTRTFILKHLHTFYAG